MDNNQKMEEILNNVRNNPSHLNYWNTYQKIKKLNLQYLNSTKEKTVKISIMSSFTADPITMYLDIECRLLGLIPEIYVSSYNQYPQDILADESRLYDFNPDLVIIAILLESILGRNYLSNMIKMSNSEKIRLQEDVLQYLDSLVSKLIVKTKSLILVNNFVIPWFSPLGILDNKDTLGVRKFHQILNYKISNVYRDRKQVFIVDLDALSSRHGKVRVVNPRLYYRGFFGISESFMPILTSEYMAYVKTIKKMSRKCIVVDLDNVLWGGILGEDGFKGIKLGENVMGQVFADFQRLLLSFYNRGIILAVVSKNNYEEAIKVIREHPGMVLKEDNFAAMRINWENKANNLSELVEELNIGLDSIVFLDDSPQEREWIRRTLPEVLVVELPSDPYKYCETIQKMNDFNSFVISDEDRRRGEMYQHRKKRQDLLRAVNNFEDFLRSLEIKIEIKEADNFRLSRIASLISRTNQFNLTGKRYIQSEIESMMLKPKNFRIYCMRVTDKFGDEGIVGVAIVKISRSNWIVDTFLMSCRVIGRKVETALIAKIAKDGTANGASYLIGEYFPTKKNKPSKYFYKIHGFEKTYEDENHQLWQLNLEESNINIPEWIQIING